MSEASHNKCVDNIVDTINEIHFNDFHYIAAQTQGYAK